MDERSQEIRRCPCEHCQQAPLGQIAQEHAAINQLVAMLKERSRRLFAALLARNWGHGGVVAVATITGLSRTTVGRGLVELCRGADDLAGRTRRRGGGRKRLEKKRPP